MRGIRNCGARRGVEDRCHGFSTNASWEKNIRGSIEQVR